MQNYDALKDTWIYQEIKDQLVDEMNAQYATMLRQSLLEITKARFPRIAALARKVALNLRQPEEIRTLLVEVATARVEREARQFLEARDDSPTLV